MGEFTIDREEDLLTPEFVDRYVFDRFVVIETTNNKEIIGILTRIGKEQIEIEK